MFNQERSGTNRLHPLLTIVIVPRLEYPRVRPMSESIIDGNGRFAGGLNATGQLSLAVRNRIAQDLISGSRGMAPLYISS